MNTVELGHTLKMPCMTLCVVQMLVQIPTQLRAQAVHAVMGVVRYEKKAERAAPHKA